MPKEYINATISLNEQRIACAEVDGLYPFQNEGYDNVAMYYPVPSGSSEITVMMNDTSLAWQYSDENYSTVLGEFPMIRWFISPVPDSFEIRTHYSHPLPKDGTYSFLYAMGTGRYLQSYAKETTAYVSINISKGLAASERRMNLHTLSYDEETGKWLWNPVNYTISQKDNDWLISLTKTSAPFHPLVEDLLVTINPSGTATLSKDSLEETTHLDKTRIVIGETVDIALTLTNKGNDTVVIEGGSSKTFDIFILGKHAGGAYFDGCFFALIVWEQHIQPNQTIHKNAQWNFFLWDPNTGKRTPPPPGTYSILGVFVGVPSGIGDILTYGVRIELVLPDINHDRIVNIIDVAIAARAFGSKPGDDRWNADADIQEDGIVDIIDLSIIVRSYGKIC
jgi:hypothetical protein